MKHKEKGAEEETRTTGSDEGKGGLESTTIKDC